MTVQLIKPLDLTGRDAGSRVSGEVHALYPAAIRMYMPNLGAYHTDSMMIVHVYNNTRTTLTRGVDWFALEMDTKVTLKCGHEIHHALMIVTADLQGSVELNYQALGGESNIDYAALNSNVASIVQGQHTSWSVIDHPQELPPKGHKQDIRDLYGLEYLTAGLNRIRDAVQTAQSFLHMEIISEYLPNSTVPLYGVLESHPQDKSDTVYFLSDLAEKNLIAEDSTLEWIHQSIQSLTQSVDTVDGLIDTQVRNSNGDISALAMAAMFISQLRQDGTLMDIPKYIAGLSAWVDFNDMVKVTQTGNVLTVIDKANTSRKFTGVGGSLVTVNRLANTRGCDLSKQPAGLNLSSGPEISIGASHTVVAVYCQSAPTTAEVFTLLSNVSGTDRLYVDNENLIQLGYTSSYGGSYQVTGMIYDDEDSHLCASSIHPRLAQCLKYSSQPSEHYPTRSTYLREVNVSGGASLMTKIGGAGSVGYLQEFLVFDHNLSRSELDALGLYYKYKYGLEFNHLANGNFCSGMSGFTSDYTQSLGAANPGEIAVIYKIALGTQTLANDNDFYLLPNFSYILRVMADNNRFLAVNTSSDVSKAFWRSSVRLVPGGKYKLKLSVLYNQEKPPHLQLKINGVPTEHTLPLSGLYTRSEDIVFDVSSPTEATTLELYNLNIAQSPNAFALDSITLTRYLGD